MKKKSNYELDQEGLYPHVFYIIKPSEVKQALENNIPLYKNDYDRYYLKYNDCKHEFIKHLKKSFYDPYTVTLLPANLTLIKKEEVK